MVKYAEAIKLPFSNWKKLLIGAAIVFFGSLIINVANFLQFFSSLVGSAKGSAASAGLSIIGFLPAIIAGFLITGYGLRGAKSAIKGKLMLPEWNNWGDLLLTGFKAVVVQFVYILPAALLILFAIILTIVSPVLGVLLFIPIIPLAVLTLYITPMAIVNFIAEEQFGAAFNIKKVFKKAFTTKYFVTVLFVIGYTIAVALLSLAALFILAITVIGPLILSAIIQVAMQITTMNAFGQAYKEIKEK